MSSKSFNIFGWTNLRAAFRWSNAHAAFVGSLAERDRAETQAIYDRVQRAHQRSPQADREYPLDFIHATVSEAVYHAGVIPSVPLRDALEDMVWGLLQADDVFFGMPDLGQLDDLSIEGAIAMRNFLATRERVLSNPEGYEKIWRGKIAVLIRGVLSYFPPAAFGSDDLATNSGFTIPLIDLCKDPAEMIERIIVTMYDDDLVQAKLLEPMRQRLDRNLAAAMGMSVEKALQSDRQPTFPTQEKGKPVREIVRTYLGGTPFADLFDVNLPFAIPYNARFEHMHILAGSGHGKTQTLQSLILRDLQAENTPSLVVIDSQGDLITNISRLARFEGQEDRLIIIDPRDVEHPPALNMFDVNLERINRYGAADREQILNGVVELYEYFFGSLLGAELTQKQSLVFRYLARLMIQIPGANLRTMIELMDDIKPFNKFIERLPESSRMFFQKEFTDRQFGETRTQVKRRLYGIIENQTFERMFSAPRNRIDLPSALNEGKIVLVNTAKDFLKGSSSILGRYFIALTLQAALERAPIPESRRHPSFLYIDEASEYFDTNIDSLLIQARKYRLGLVVAHQYLDQLQGGLRSSIAANTSIKFAGGISDRDAHAVASDMRTTPSFLLEQRKGTKETHFAAYIRNVTGSAISLSVPFGQMETEPRMSQEAYDNLIAGNRSRVSGGVFTIEDGPESSRTGDPVVSLRTPDLPWRLEPEEPSRPVEKPPNDGVSTDASPEW